MVGLLSTDLITTGYILEWASTPSLQITPISRRVYSNQVIYTTEIEKLLEMDVIQNMDPTESCFVSNLFLVPKKSGDLRPVIDLRKLNQHIRYAHFKMEGIELVKSLVRREDYMISIDLTQAFYHVPVSSYHRKVLLSIS